MLGRETGNSVGLMDSCAEIPPGSVILLYLK
jgi:hypothetical protein